MGKYMDDADKYSRKVNTVKNGIQDAVSQLNNVSKALGLNPKRAKDMLTYSVVSCNGDLKSKMRNLQSDLTNCVNVITKAAARIDRRIEEEARRGEKSTKQ